LLIKNTYDADSYFFFFAKHKIHKINLLNEYLVSELNNKKIKCIIFPSLDDKNINVSIYHQNPKRQPYVSWILKKLIFCYANIYHNLKRANLE